MENSDLRHRDAFGRIQFITEGDATKEHFLRPEDGRIVPILVQESYEETKTENLTSEQKTWYTTGEPELRIPAIIEIVHWTFSSILQEGSEERHYGAIPVIMVLFKWIPACLILAVLIMVSQSLEVDLRNDGWYDKVRYHDWGYPKVSRNRLENRNNDEDRDELVKIPPLDPDDIEMSAYLHHIPVLDRVSEVDNIDEEYDSLPARHFRPRYLCFLENGSDGTTQCATWKVADWVKEHGPTAETDFVFLSYTRKHFCVATEKELASWDLPSEEIRAAYVQLAKKDRRTLLNYGIEAARSAGKNAFWLDFECVRDTDNEAKATSHSDDVYRICDIVRAAHSMAILVGPPLASRLPDGMKDTFSPEAMVRWLQEWGTRLWTLPEILLCSPEYRVKIFAIGGPSNPKQLAKRNFASYAWRDAKLVRQLVDHYESSIILTPLELVSIALECLANRQTDQFNNGDMVYALMGLLRRRPAINKSDTSFEAFARLSLANDSDELLERLLCMQPIQNAAPWYEMKDAWGAHLWDIEPRCQIGGIVDDQVVTLDGVYGATIAWDCMEPVAFLMRETTARARCKQLISIVPQSLLAGLLLTLYNASNLTADVGGFGINLESLGTFLVWIGILTMLAAFLILLATPAMLLHIYSGKFWSTQAHFIGIQGRADLGLAERYLFGFNRGRLKWSTNGSMLSRHRLKDGECLPMPPDITEDYAGSRPGETLFTLIDTYSMTATCFYAERPPVAVMICGQEGGMQRAVLCSYDWRRQTFTRETVLRMKTLVLDRMFRIDRFRFALRRTTPVK